MTRIRRPKLDAFMKIEDVSGSLFKPEDHSRLQAGLRQAELDKSEIPDSARASPFISF
jgi:hypothetical protein